MERGVPRTKAEARKGGRPKKTRDAASQVIGKSATDAVSAKAGVSKREVNRAIRRTDVEPEVAEAYAKGELVQTQVDEVAKLPRERQAAVTEAGNAASKSAKLA